MEADPVPAFRAWLLDNGHATEAQLAEMEKSFGAMLRQLPNRTEVPNLLVDISQTGLAAGLEEKLFQPANEEKKDFYAELPIKIRLTGSYHDFGEFVSGIAALPPQTAVFVGHEYTAVTDHSPRLTVARGLSSERLADQLDLIDDLNEALAPFRVLKGIEVDILDDGTLDQSPFMLNRLDVVVASVHSKLAMDAESMTHRMVAAIANPRTNILGHCTGRLIEGERGTRGESSFDAEVVFEACRAFDVAVEINSRPERCDPPDRLLALANEAGCLFSIDTDAHAPGQLEFLAYGAARAEAAGIDPDRIVTTWPVQRLLDWATSR